jgi:hypothetical protein
MNIGPYGENVSKRFFSETTWTIETKLPSNDHWKVLYTVSVFYADRKSKMAFTAEPALKKKLFRGPSNDYSWAVWFHLSKWFQRGSVLRHFSHRVQC